MRANPVTYKECRKGIDIEFISTNLVIYLELSNHKLRLNVQLTNGSNSMNPEHVEKSIFPPTTLYLIRNYIYLAHQMEKFTSGSNLMIKVKHALINCAFRTQDHVGLKLLKLDRLSRYTWRTSRHSLVCRAPDTTTRMR